MAKPEPLLQRLLIENIVDTRRPFDSKQLLPPRSWHPLLEGISIRNNGTTCTCEEQTARLGCWGRYLSRASRVIVRPIVSWIEGAKGVPVRQALVASTLPVGTRTGKLEVLRVCGRQE